MAMFTKDATEKGDGRTNGAAGTDGGLSIIAAGMRVTGDLETPGVVKVEGSIEGSITGARQVLVGRAGEVRGDIHAREAVIGGKVIGAIIASERVEIQDGSSVNGDISTKAIVVQDGGRINGAVRMDEGAAHAAKAAESRSGPVAIIS